MKPHQWMASAAVSWKTRLGTDDDFELRARLLEMCEIRGDCWVSVISSIEVPVRQPKKPTKNKTVAAQRAAYVLFSGPLGRGDEIISFCRNKRCCCPDHLHRVPWETIDKARKRREKQDNGTR